MNRLLPSAVPITRRRLLKLAAVQAALSLADAVRPHASVRAVAAPDPPITLRDRPRLQPFDTDELDEVVRQSMAAIGVPGVAIGIIVDDWAYTRGFGVTNIDHPLPVDEHTLFQIGSITKTYTGTALLRYVDRGAITLDTPISQYLPDLKLADPASTAGVTLRHLMTHTSGLPANDFRAFGGGDDALARFADHLAELPLLLPLGFSPSYSNPGVSLEGRLLEVLAGRPYESAIRAELLDPLGMDRATFFADEAIRFAAAVGHTPVGGRPVVQSVWGLPRTANPTGGLLTSLRDQLTYARFWLDGGVASDGRRLLSPESYRANLLVHAPLYGEDPAVGGAAMGLHWVVLRVDGLPLLAYNGATWGQESSLALVPDRRFAFAGLSNAAGGAAVLQAARGRAMQRLLGIEPPRPAAPDAIPMTPVQRLAYHGEYENPGEAVLTLEEHDGALVLSTTATDPVYLAVLPAPPLPPPMRLAFAAPDRAFFAEQPSEQIPFLLGVGGEVLGLFASARFYRKR